VPAEPLGVTVAVSVSVVPAGCGDAGVTASDVVVGVATATTGYTCVHVVPVTSMSAA